ncbi:hypothetical protein I6A60_39345 [Frankia sp. AgB1.9]|uniref:hypothetical protein n=1 Tax=unclassified Frankia TaxID=2632575 RepID=UPI001934056A|nr:MULTISPECIES: hypothetical protein [unclassified Frankia]MBL7491615.1 hypothetical protein [Frankia sp. AgW1.1]MBL7553840.1 hypothetical protein [Frankia sp. AgB1.9]MBL7618085.1 hypothetical protein [Frankia sp. AgB1.8]
MSNADGRQALLRITPAGTLRIDETNETLNGYLAFLLEGVTSRQAASVARSLDLLGAALRTTWASQPGQNHPRRKR